MGGHCPVLTTMDTLHHKSIMVAKNNITKSYGMHTKSTNHIFFLKTQ